jgi:hypothetical protein
MAFCFSEAFVARRENRISEQEYIGHLTAHLRGIRHEDDDLENKRVGDQLHSISMFTSLFRLFALSNRTLPTEGDHMFISPRIAYAYTHRYCDL